MSTEKNTDLQNNFKKTVRLSSFLAIFLGACFGYWVAVVLFQWLSTQFPGEDIGAAWGSRVAAAIAFWKAAMEAVNSFKFAWLFTIGKEKKFDHIKALSGVATLAFALTLGFKTFIPGFDKKQLHNLPTTEFVYVVSHQGRIAPSFLTAPTLVFKSAALANPDIPQFLQIENIEAATFISESVNLAERQLVSITSLINKLATECIYDGAKEKLKLEVRGFANNQPFLDKNRKVRADTDLLNLAISNLRGKAVYDALSTIIEQKYPSLTDEIDIDWGNWLSLQEMKTNRDNYVFRNVQIALSPSIDHRSAVIIVTEPGTCPQLDSYDSKSNPPVSVDK